MIKLVVSDMDGTLTYDSNNKNSYDIKRIGLPIQNEQAIKQILGNGILFAVATGRLLTDVEAVLSHELAANCYKLVQNGSFILDCENNLLAQEVFTNETARTIYSILEESGLNYTCSIIDKHFHDDKFNLNNMADTFGSNVPCLNITSVEQRPPQPANICVVRNNTEALRQDLALLKEKLDPQLVNFQITGPHTIDINPKSVSKANGIAKLIHRLGIQPHEVLVVGDSYNDLSMFENFEHSFVMSHAFADLKSRARHEIDMFSDILCHHNLMTA